MSAAAAATAVRRALDLLGAARPADWRNGTASASGSLHWRVAVNRARRELRQGITAF